MDNGMLEGFLEFEKLPLFCTVVENTKPQRDGVYVSLCVRNDGQHCAHARGRLKALPSVLCE